MKRQHQLAAITSDDHSTKNNTSSNSTNDEATRRRAAKIQTKKLAVEYMIVDLTIDHVQLAPKNVTGTATKLIVDVLTRRNYSYHMFWRLLCLQKSCD